MRILHTSDWHLGLELDGYSRIAEQELFLNWLLQTCQTEQIDALLVAGDVYDTFNPSIEAQNIFSRFLVQLRQSMPHLTMVIIAGNHDSAQRLELPSPFAHALEKIHLAGLKATIVPLLDKNSQVKSVCIAVPFLRPSDLQVTLDPQISIRESYHLAIEKFTQDLCEQAQNHFPNVPKILMGHMALESTSASKSERPIIGGLDSIPASMISQGMQYVALGHLHKAQKVEHDWIRFCGSPISIDMDERKYHHQVLVVTFDEQMQAQTHAIEVPNFVDMLRLPEKPGDWDDALNALKNYSWSSEVKSKDLQPFVQLHLSANTSLADLQVKLEALAKQFPVRLLNPKREVIESSAQFSLPAKTHFDLQAQDMPLQLLELAWHNKKGDTPIPIEIKTLFAEIETQVRLELP